MKNLQRVRPRPAPRGPAAIISELFVYRYGEVTTKGLKRALIANLIPTSNLEKVLWMAGVGRYRVEGRDTSRQVRQVRVYEVLPDGRVHRTTRLPKRRKVPSPMFVG